MKSKGLMFKPEMVRSILSGTKTQTRRRVKPAKAFPDSVEARQFDDGWFWFVPGALRPIGRIRIPHPVGSEIYVKETWQAWHRVNVEYDEWEPLTREARNGESWDTWIETRGEPDALEYRATSDSVGPWASAMLMPKRFARIFLEVTEVRVQRLQEVTEADAEAEGSKEPSLVPIVGGCFTERDVYAKYWEHINGKGSWGLNPWVWCYTFKVKK